MGFATNVPSTPGQKAANLPQYSLTGSTASKANDLSGKVPSNQVWAQAYNQGAQAYGGNANAKSWTAPGSYTSTGYSPNPGSTKPTSGGASWDGNLAYAAPQDRPGPITANGIGVDGQSRGFQDTMAQRDAFVGGIIDRLGTQTGAPSFDFNQILQGSNEKLNKGEFVNPFNPTPTSTPSAENAFGWSNPFGNGAAANNPLPDMSAPFYDPTPVRPGSEAAESFRTPQAPWQNFGPQSFNPATYGTPAVGAQPVPTNFSSVLSQDSYGTDLGEFSGRQQSWDPYADTEQHRLPPPWQPKPGDAQPVPSQGHRLPPPWQPKPGDAQPVPSQGHRLPPPWQPKPGDAQPVPSQNGGPSDVKDASRMQPRSFGMEKSLQEGRKLGYSDREIQVSVANGTPLDNYGGDAYSAGGRRGGGQLRLIDSGGPSPLVLQPGVTTAPKSTPWTAFTPTKPRVSAASENARIQANIDRFAASQAEIHHPSYSAKAMDEETARAAKAERVHTYEADARRGPEPQKERERAATEKARLDANAARPAKPGDAQPIPSQFDANPAPKSTAVERQHERYRSLGWSDQDIRKAAADGRILVGSKPTAVKPVAKAKAKPKAKPGQAYGTPGYAQAPIMQHRPTYGYR